MIDYSKLQLSLHHLELQYENLLHLPKWLLPELVTEWITESVIQRFEVCYDCMWKVLARYLREELGLADVPASPKPIFRLAAENELLPSPVEQWMRYAEARIGTSHDYSGEKAKECLNIVGDFIADSRELYTTMSKELWQS